MSKEFGYFENPLEGYSLTKIPGSDRRKWLLFTSCDYKFQLNLERPLTFHKPSGVRIQPDRHESLVTDMGSIPSLLRPIIPKDRFLLSFIFHDSGLEHGGLYFSDGPGLPFIFREQSRYMMDLLLPQLVGAEGGNAFQRRAIYKSVHAWAIVSGQ